MAELADALDLGSSGREALRVRIPPFAPFLAVHREQSGPTFQLQP